MITFRPQQSQITSSSILIFNEKVAFLKALVRVSITYSVCLLNSISGKMRQEDLETLYLQRKEFTVFRNFRS